MSDWGWVALAYTVTYGAMATYATFMFRRVRRTRHRLEEMQ